ncbi:MAG: hypothetical protein FWB86_03865 [Treponema sp.]|nr:hypothetical protein [Treponema sp.]MCL2251151.1 hypothetical protein [Treponema sp.]
MKSSINSTDDKRKKRTKLQIIMIASVFCILKLITGIISYNFASNILREQLVFKCKSVALTVASVIASDSEGYKNFLNTLDMESDYYSRTKELMMNIKRANTDQVTYIYTETRIDNDMMMYVIGGEDPSSPEYTAPGVKDTLVAANKEAYDKMLPTSGINFEDTEYGTRLSAYAPIFHKDTGEFLGLVGADITRFQYNNVMNIILFETIAGILIVFFFFVLIVLLF